MSSETNTTILEQMRHGIALARSGDRVGAEIAFNAVLNRRPNDVEALVWKAAVVSDPKAAIGCLEHALRINPDHQRAQRGLEWAYNRKKDQATQVEEISPYKKRRLRNEPPLPKENQPSRKKTQPESQVFRAASHRVEFTIAPRVFAINRDNTPVPLRLPLALFGFAIGLALISFWLSLLAPILGIAAIACTIGGIALFDRAAL